MRDLYGSQYAITRITLDNFGSWDGHSVINVAAKQTAGGISTNIVGGGSGSGKSTIIDALSFVLHQSNPQKLNRAAEQVNGRSKDDQRSLLTYMQGVQGRVVDRAMNEHINALRPNDERPVWTSISVEFTNVLDESVITGAMLAFLPACTKDAGDIKKRYVIADGRIDPLAIERNGLGSEAFRASDIKRMWPRSVSFTAFSSYQQELCSRLGTTPAAMKSLYNVTSTSSFDSVNDLYTRHALPDPSCTGFLVSLRVELSNTIEFIRKFTKQLECINALTPLKDMSAEYDGLKNHLVRLEKVTAGPDNSTELAVWGARLVVSALKDSIDSMEDEVETKKQELGDAKSRSDALSASRDEKIRALAARDEAVKALKAKAETLHERWTIRLRTLERIDRELTGCNPDSRETWDSTKSKALEWADEAASSIRGLRSEEEAAGANVYEQKLKHDEAKEALRTAEQSGTAITADMMATKEAIADACNLNPSYFKYFGELVNVDREHSEWRRAADAALCGTADLLLIPKKYQHVVEDRLAGGMMKCLKTQSHAAMKRFVYQFVDTEIGYDSYPHEGCLSSIIAVDDSPFSDWVRWKLCNLEPCDYRLAYDPEDIKQPGMLLRSGEVSWIDGGAAGRKDGIIIGFRDESIIQQAKAYESDCAAKLKEAERNQRSIRKRIAEMEQRCSAIDQIRDISFDDVDVASAAEAAKANEAELERLSSDDGYLQLQKEKERIECDLAAARRNVHELEDQIAYRTNCIANGKKCCKRQQKILEDSQGMALDSESIALLDKLLDEHLKEDGMCRDDLSVLQPSKMAVTEALKDVGKEIGTKKDQDKQQLDKMETSIVAQMEVYYRHYNEDGRLPAATFENLNSYLGLLESLQNEQLEKTRNKSAGRSIFSVAGLAGNYTRSWDDDIDSADSNLDDLNEIMAGWKFGPKRGHISIAMKKRIPLEAQDFIRRLKAFSTRATRYHEGSWPTDEEIDSDLAAMEGFKETLDKESKSWYRSVYYNPYLCVEFIAKVEDEGETKECRILRNSNSMSGGEREEFYCVLTASAMLYEQRLGRGEKPKFAPYIMDEAFIHSDAKTTMRCFDILKNAGFQVIAVAPEGKVAAMERDADNAICVAKHIDGRSCLAEFTRSDEPKGDAA